MIIYVDPKLIGRKNFESLMEKYPEVEFVTDTDKRENIEVLITMPKIVKEMNLDEYPKLRWIQYLMAGYDGVDLDMLKSKGIVFCNAQDIFSKSIAEDVFTKIFYFNRSVRYYIDEMKKGTWNPIKEEPELTGSNALILGVGSIGKELARRMKAFEMNVVGYRAKPVTEPEFDEIITEEHELYEALESADYVILALPLNEKTYQMFDKTKFNHMKKSALFINVARGQVVNQSDMYQILKEKRIRGAGLDVLDPEPLPCNHPLWQLDNVYITPHNASSSPHMRNRLYEMIIENLDLYLANKPVKYRLN